MIRYGVWNGIKYDNTLGDDKAPEGLDLKALKNFNPGNPIDVVIGTPAFWCSTIPSVWRESCLATTKKFPRLPAADARHAAQAHASLNLLCAIWSRAEELLSTGITSMNRPSK